MDLYDIRKSIYLHCNIDDIESLYLADKLSWKILSSDSFWIDKFEYDNFLYFKNGSNLRNWLKEYKHVENIKDAVNIILTTNTIENEIYKNRIFPLEEQKCNKIRILCLPDHINILLEEFNNVLKFIKLIKGQLIKEDIVDNSIGHIKIELNNNTYDLSYNIHISSIEHDYINIPFVNNIEYSKVKNILTRALYNEFVIKDPYHVNYLFDGGGDYESNSKIVSDTLIGLEDNELLKLPNSPAKTILLINEIENAAFTIFIKRYTKYLFSDIKPNELKSTLNALIPEDFVNLIYKTINEINSQYSFFNINIEINQIPKGYLMKCFIKVYLNNDISYNIKVKQCYSPLMIAEILNKAMNLGLHILDCDLIDIYCDFYPEHNTYGEWTSYNRTIRRKVIELY